MAAVEFTENGKPSSEKAKAVIKAAAKRNLLLLSCGTYSNIIRWIPPLIVTREQVSEALSLFEEALEDIK